ncbi:hypothetical protein HS088_TW06G00722 [Tripterygium wilfordii]|uniref:Uncharacterized protein n=1 Tax=Tripterygium wilfordii TaxID=458696 RepID=A0A7J7DJN7_TRIWF|nr:hypothetical protein HS088_TW06G00722 [Tripterygium wilfordii]
MFSRKKVRKGILYDNINCVLHYLIAAFHDWGFILISMVTALELQLVLLYGSANNFCIPSMFLLYQVLCSFLDVPRGTFIQKTIKIVLRSCHFLPFYLIF